METRYEWLVEYLSYYALEDRLNELSREGYSVVKIQFIPGAPEKMVAGLQGKQRRSDEWIVILRREASGTGEGGGPDTGLPDLMELEETDPISETVPDHDPEDWDERD